jgi:hypothetical protein
MSILKLKECDGLVQPIKEKEVARRRALALQNLISDVDSTAALVAGYLAGKSLTCHRKGALFRCIHGNMTRATQKYSGNFRDRAKEDGPPHLHRLQRDLPRQRARGLIHT